MEKFFFNDIRFEKLLTSKLGDVRPLQEQSSFALGSSYIEREPNEPKISDFEKKFQESLPNLKKEYPCIPNKSSWPGAGKKNNLISSYTKNSILKTIFFIRENKSTVLSSFNCDEKTLLFLFKIAIAIGDEQSGLGTFFADNEKYVRAITKFDSMVSGILGMVGIEPVQPIMSIAKKFSNKEGSVGTFQMHPSHLKNLPSTQKLMNISSSNSVPIYSDIQVGIFAVMELLLNTYRDIKKRHNYNGPSVDDQGKPIPGLSGDYNWDVALSSYDQNIDTYLDEKFCKTDNIYFVAPCKYSGRQYNPGDTNTNRKIDSLKIPTPPQKKDGKYILNVTNTVVPNYLPLLLSGRVTNNRIVIKFYLDYLNKLSCITKF